MPNLIFSNKTSITFFIIQATYNISLDHPPYTIALSNMPNLVNLFKYYKKWFNFKIFYIFMLKYDIPLSEDNSTLQSVFAKTPKLPTYLVGFVILNQSDFGLKEVSILSNRTNVRLNLN